MPLPSKAAAVIIQRLSIGLVLSLRMNKGASPASPAKPNRPAALQQSLPVGPALATEHADVPRQEASRRELLADLAGLLSLWTVMNRVTLRSRCCDRYRPASEERNEDRP